MESRLSFGNLGGSSPGYLSFSHPGHGHVYPRVNPGRGLVEIIGGELMTEEQFRALQATVQNYNAIQIDEGLHLVERIELTRKRLGSVNHSCDSNLWLADEVTIVARRDIAAKEELTVDYALFSAQPDWVMEGPCHCGSPVCRGIITGNDWRLKEVQNRYYPHFIPFLNLRIEQLLVNS